MNTQKIYFPNLNSLRFIAAFLVFIHHVEFSLNNLKLPNVYHITFFQIIGKLGVVLFFVLSGFLITYFLLVEKNQTKTVNIKYFLIRRILRIFPLYYLIVISALLVFPNLNMMSNIIESNAKFEIIIPMYLLLLPNVVEAINYKYAPISHTWSIGTEEQFYLLWPFAIKKSKNVWKLLFSVIMIYVYLYLLIYYYFKEGGLKTKLLSFLLHTPIDCMAIGGLFALILIEQSEDIEKIKSFIFSKKVQWFALIAVASMFIFGVRFPLFHYEIYSIFFGILIINFAANNNRIFSLEYSILSYLGKISYGLYMFQPVAFSLSYVILFKLKYFNHINYYILTFFILVGISALSYNFFEKPFLKMKRKYYSN